MRNIIEALVLALCSLIFALPGPSETNAADCVSKDAMTSRIVYDHPDAITTDLAGEYEKLFLANLSRITGEDMMSYDVVIYRAPGKSTTLLMFFKNECADTQVEIRNSTLLKILQMA